jgi:hypothetical protein
MVIYHSWVQELFGGKRYQKFSVKQVSDTLVEIWLRGMRQPGGSDRVHSSHNGNHGAIQEQHSGEANS